VSPLSFFHFKEESKEDESGYKEKLVLPYISTKDGHDRLLSWLKEKTANNYKDLNDEDPSPKSDVFQLGLTMCLMAFFKLDIFGVIKE